MMFLYYLTIFLMLNIAPPLFSQQKILLREDFPNLNNWEALTFPKIKNHSVYTVKTDNSGNYLQAESNASASGLIYKNTFNVYDYPRIRWRWKVENVYQKGNAKKKSGDDYPIRIYIIFKYDPDRVGFFEGLKYSSAKLIYGKYPPYSALNYIWANREHKDRIITNTYTDRAEMILLRQGSSNVGRWVEEDVNILEDYRKAFHEDPPPIASLAIMNDSDNTGEQSVSYVDYIEIYK